MSDLLELGTTSPELSDATGLFRVGRLREAERACRRILARQPKHARALHLLALIADRAGRKADSAELLKRAVACAPDDPVVHHGLANLLLRTGSADDALSACERAHALDPGSPFILASLGQAWLRKHEHAKAEDAYRRALKLEPDYAGAHNNLGTVLAEQGRRGEAETSYRRAIALDPRTAGLRLNLARLLIDDKRLDEAQAVLTDALAQAPAEAELRRTLARVTAMRDDPAANKAAGSSEAPALSERRAHLSRLFERAHAEQAQGRLKDAEATCREVLALDQDHAGAWHLLGIVALRAGDPQTAMAHIERAVTLAPARVDCRNSLGFALRAMGRNDDATAAFREAAVLDPNFVEAHYQLGNLLREAKRNAEAEASYRRVLALQPDHHQAHNNLGAALGELRRFEEAATHFRRAAELKPGYAEAHSNLGHALRASGHPQDAEAACRRAIALAPRLAVSHLNLGLLLQDMGRMDDALASFRRAGALDRDYAMATACEGMLHLLRGNLAAGWDKYEARWRIGDLPPRDFAQPQWRGEPLAGRTILLHAEQGFGDTIQFLRYVPLVIARGGKVVLEIQKPMLPLAPRVEGIAVVARGDALPAFDLQCPLLSLPLAFGTTLEGLPAATPYLAPAPERVAYWRERIGTEPGLEVGIAWAGSPVHRNDRNRSIALERFKPLFELAGARFFSLQVGRSADLAAIEPMAIADLSGELTDFGETAAAIANLDLVIAADTALVHLAGALGKPVWTMLPFSPDWRWLLGRADSPWYPTMRLFRQPRPGDWDGVVGEVRQALADRLAGAPQRPNAAERAEYVALVAAAKEHHQAMRHAECEAALRRALAVDPSNGSALHMLGLARHALDDKTEAVELMQRALALEPSSAIYLRDLGIMLHGAMRFDEALEASRRSVAIDPDDPATHNGVGATLAELDRPAEAIAAFRRALELKPDYYECWGNLAHSQQALLQFDAAADSCRRALGIRYDYPEAQVSTAMLALLRGDYANGFTQFEWRWRLKIMTPRDFKQPAWQGEPLDGKTILLHAEQGYGDTLQCLRFVPEVAAGGGRLVLELPPPLAQLATSLDGGGEIVLQGRALPPFDVHCAFMSLPRALGINLDNLAQRPVPYLRADPAAVDRWARRLSGTGSGLRVGLAWAGYPKHAAGRRRSIPVERLAGLTRVAGVRFYSLQVGERAQDLALLPPDQVIDLSRELATFAETAAALANLDLVITVDTALAHLAGALGRRCWVLLAFSPDWRWLTERTDSPWYPSLRLFRQTSLGAWDEVLARVARALSKLAPTPRRPAGPPLDAGGLFAQAAATRKAGRTAETETLARRILASEPDHQPSLNLLGVLREQAGDHTEAANLFARVAELAPDDAEAHYNLAIVLMELGRVDEAIGRYRRAIARKPDHAKAHSNLGGALRIRGRLDEAEAACRRALTIDPDSASAHVNLGTVLTSRDQLDEAAQSFRRATELKPDLAEAFLNLGLALHNQGRFEEALAQCRRATSVRLDYADAHMAEAFALLTMGRDFADALAKLEWRWRLADRKIRTFKQPLWLGEMLNGKTILLHAEQGFGDSLMLLRYAPMVAARGGRLVIEVPKGLARLATRAAGGPFPVIAEGAALPPFDVQCPLMTLPAVLGTKLDTIPAQVPYLTADPEAVRRWSERLGAAPGLKVGIAWAGSPQHVNDFRRSIELERLKPLLDVPGVSFISLQVGPRAAGLAALPPGTIVDLSAELTDFAETAGAMLNLDLVIAVDTAVVHLAGALARSAWVMLPFSPDWRWMLEREDSPWYPSLRLYRQPRPGDWDNVIARVAADLRQRAAAHVQLQRG
jgi:tetratricopeptide (TPR) repeat protein